MEFIIVHPSLLFGKQIMVICYLSQIGEFEIIEAHCKVFGQQLPDSRVDDAERFTRSRGSQNHDTSKRIDIDISVMYPLLKIKLGRDIDRCRRCKYFSVLHKRFRFYVPLILSKIGIDELGYIINGNHCQYSPHNTDNDIERPINIGVGKNEIHLGMMGFIQKDQTSKKQYQP